MLISGVLPIMSLYRLPHGQYAYSGHVINLPQDVASFANSLPRLPCELDIIVVRKKGAADSHRDFRVRRAVVLRALQWLLANNKYYRSVRIDPDALALLPEDGDLTGLRSVTLETTDDPEPPSTQDEDHYDTHLSLFCPQYCSANDRAGDYQAVSPSTTISLAASGSPYSVVASQQFNTHQWVQHRGLHHMRLPNIVSDWRCWLCCSTTACCHYRELLQTPDDVWRWSIHQTSSLSLLCPQHRDALAGSTCRSHLHSSAFTWCPTLGGGAPRHGRSWRRSLLQPSTVLRYQFAWNKAVLVQAA